jgi:site-specific DNA-cytosine methylase
MRVSFRLVQTHHTDEKSPLAPLPAALRETWKAAYLPEIRTADANKQGMPRTAPCPSVRQALNDLPVEPATDSTRALQYRKVPKHIYQKLMHNDKSAVVSGHVLPSERDRAPIDSVMLDETDLVRTLTTSGSKWMHHRKPRKFTVRESARLQSASSVLVLRSLRFLES